VRIEARAVKEVRLSRPRRDEKSADWLGFGEGAAGHWR
jgi:hypothetical protein